MLLEIYGDHLTLTQAHKDEISKKLDVLNKYLVVKEDTICRIVGKVSGDNVKAEVSIPSVIGLLRAETVHTDLKTAIDLSIDKIEDQIKRQKSRLNRRHKESLAEQFVEEVNKDDSIVVRTKQVHADPLDIEEAIIELDLSGHDFFIYHDIDSDCDAVVYVRKDGQYGLIEIR